MQTTTEPLVVRLHTALGQYERSTRKITVNVHPSLMEELVDASDLTNGIFSVEVQSYGDDPTQLTVMVAGTDPEQVRRLAIDILRQHRKLRPILWG